MKVCSYCGRENEEKAIACRECGTENASDTVRAPGATRIRLLLSRPANTLGLAAAIVLFQGAIRLGLTPNDPTLGEGDVKHLEAVFWLWGSLGLSAVLAACALHLRNKSRCNLNKQ